MQPRPRKLSFALAATGVAAVSAPSAEAYTSATAASHEGYGNQSKEPKADPKPKQAAPAQQAPPPPRQPDPPPEPSRAVEQVARQITAGAQSVQNSQPQRESEPKRETEPQGREPVRQQGPAPDAARAVKQVASGVTQGARSVQRSEAQGQRQPEGRNAPASRPASPAGTVDQVARDVTDGAREVKRATRDKPDRQPARRADREDGYSSLTATSHRGYKITDEERLERAFDRYHAMLERDAQYPRSGARVPRGHELPSGWIPDAGESLSRDGDWLERALFDSIPGLDRYTEVARSDTFEGRGGREVSSISATKLREADQHTGAGENALGKLLVGLASTEESKVGDDSPIKALRKLAGRVNRFGFSDRSFEGRESTVEAMLRAGHADRVADGTRPAPDPRRPGTLRRGEFVIFSREEYEGQDSMRKVFLEGRLVTAEGERLSTAVQRVGGDRVRVWVGQEDTLSRHLSINLGIGSDIDLEYSDSAEGKLRSIDVRLGTGTGRDTLRRALATGELPFGHEPAVVRERLIDSHVEAFEDDGVSSAVGGPVYEGFRQSTIRRPGSPARVVEVGDKRDISMRSSYPHGASGSAGARYELEMENVYEFGTAGGDPVDMRMTLAADDIRSMMRWARGSDDLQLSTWQQALAMRRDPGEAMRWMLADLDQASVLADELEATRIAVERATGTKPGYMTVTPSDSG